MFCRLHHQNYRIKKKNGKEKKILKIKLQRRKTGKIKNIELNVIIFHFDIPFVVIAVRVV